MRSDESGNNRHGLIHGAQPGTNRFNEEGMALFFDGEDDYAPIAVFGIGKRLHFVGLGSAP